MSGAAPKRTAGHRLRRGLRNLVVIAIAASAYQLVSEGRLDWPGDLLRSLGQMAGERPAGWELARDTLEERGARREGLPAPHFDLRGRVVRVADGDTLSVLDSEGKQHKIRLYGIDTPEYRQPHGEAARQALVELVYQEAVGLVVIETDDYRRKVATVYHEGRNINLELVAAGHAWWYRYHAPQERLLQAAEREARSRGLGLWAAAEPVPPWDWRRQNRQ